MMESLSDRDLYDLNFDWSFWARPKQLAPPGDWATWNLRAGRGFGKTRTGAEWLNKRAEEEPGRWMAILAQTPADARDYCIEGKGGLLQNAHPDRMPNYEPSKRRVTWPNGSWATIYSDEKPDQLRGFSGDTSWIDEIGKFSHPRACWDNLAFGMREASADQPRILITSTPRPIKILREIEAMDDTVTVIGSSYENRSNLDPRWFAKTLRKYEGTTTGRQEIYAEMLAEAEGALWKLIWFDQNRVSAPPTNEMRRRTAVGVDPSGSAGGDEVGIITACRIDGDTGCTLADDSGHYTPEGWARKAVLAYFRWEADYIVAEGNYGGEMVRTTIASTAREMKRNGEIKTDHIPIEIVHASRGKAARAEPIAAMYEQGRVAHYGTLGDLEDQCVTWEPNTGDASPDRLDALVWAYTWLFIDDMGDLSVPLPDLTGPSYTRGVNR